MADNITVVTARAPLTMAKTWLPDGSTTPYDNGMNFKAHSVQVSNITELSALLGKLASKPRSCIIRGGYIGDELAIPIMRAEEKWTPGFVLRRDDVFKDRALHMVLIDVDGFNPLMAYPEQDPVACMDEYICEVLPECFHGVSYHWQLSNSAGLEKNRGLLKAHLWFWLETAYTTSELKSWHMHSGFGKAVDDSMFRIVQAHYTSDPVMSKGVVDPIAVRSGFVIGSLGDSVKLVIPEDVRRSSWGAVSRVERAEIVSNAVQNDPVAQRLYDQKMVRGIAKAGALNIACPREDNHTGGETGPTSCNYYIAHTNGYIQGNFVCQHASCKGQPQHLFREALGFSVLDDFGDVDEDFQQDGDVNKTALTMSPVQLPSVDLTGLVGSSNLPAVVQPDAAVAAVVSPLKRARAVVPEARHLCTDQANVQRLLKYFGKRMLVASDRWYAWDGRRWVPDDSIATRYAMTLSKIIAQEAQEWDKKPAVTGEEESLNKNIAKALKGWSTKAEMRSTIDAALALAKRVLSVDDNILDSDPWLLNCENGTVDLRTGRLQPHDQNDYITKICPVSFYPEAKCPSFESVLLRVCCEEGGPSPVAKFLQRWFGYCATASTREQKFVVHYGLGSNGKSTILDVISETMGDYAGTAAPGLLVAGGKDRHPTEIADLFGRRMVTAHESSEGGILREDFVKQATGGDRIKARFMRADFFEFAPTHKIQLLTNHKPIIKGQDHGIWRRVVMVPYKARFGTPEEVAIGSAMYPKDVNVLERLRNEKEGVLRWLVDGAVSWYRDGLNPPDYVLAASGEYQKEQDRVLLFLQENCDMDPSYSVFLNSEMEMGLFQVYELWCKEGGFFSLSKIRFLQEIERLVPAFQKKTVKIQTFSGRRRDVLQIFGVRLME